EQAAVRAGPVHQVIVPVPVPVPVLKPVAVASPVAEPAMTPESVAAIRTLAELRARTAFYRLLNRTLWTIGALASCAVGIYLISQQPQVDQRTTVIDAPPQPPIYVSPREARTVVRPSIDVVQKIEPVQKKAEPGPTTPKPVKVEVAPALTATTFEKVEEPRDDRPFFILPEPDKPTSAEDLAAWQEKTFADRIAQAIGERAPKNPSHTWLVHALGVCFRSPIERHETFAEITRHLGETIDGSTPEGRKVVLALKRFSGGADQQRSVRKATEREKCVKKCRDASRKALVQIAHRSK
ncbi:MAG TPA: hypothetical protein VJ783_26530, partial [Pirellulales bacterium]|nr:hypothetical protein [Pirellulales bacterium]